MCRMSHSRAAHTTLVPMDDSELSSEQVVARLRAAGCVFAEDEADVILGSAAGPAELADMVARRERGVPLEHVVGWAELCGQRILVTDGVFVPRRRTELLATEALALVRPGATVVDMCCGSGAIAAVIFAAVRDIDVFAVDIEPAAVACARRNLPGAVVAEGDLDAPLPDRLRGRVDVLIANTPYVPTGDVRLLPREARLHEPTVTFDGGADGLDIQRRVAALSGTWLAPGGHLLIETSAEQAEATFAVFVGAGLSTRVVTSDELDATVVIGTLPAFGSASVAGVRATFSES
ncbi:MAG: HemK family modification methylase [Acidimicrobiales bacterium]|nr:HemK family modification methylase [Acidimicrobiales bacterium]